MRERLVGGDVDRAVGEGLLDRGADLVRPGAQQEGVLHELVGRAAERRDAVPGGPADGSTRVPPPRRERTSPAASSSR